MKHLTEAEINAIVQYEYGNNEFFNSDESEIQKLKKHLETCIACQKRYKKSKQYYSEISSLPEPKTFVWQYSAAAILLIASIPFLLSNSLNQESFIDYKEFGFTIYRGDSKLTSDLEKELTYLLNEKQYDEAISLCQKNKLTKNNIYYFAALIMRGQSNDDPSDIEKGIKILEHDSLSHWRLQAEKILKK